MENPVVSAGARAEERWHYVLLALCVIFYLFVFPHGINGDAGERYRNLLTFLGEGRLTPMYFSYVGPLVSAPLHYLGFVTKDSYWWVSRFNTFVFLGTAYSLWRFLRKDWGAEQSRIFLLLLFCGGMFPKHCMDYYSEVFSACAAALAITAFLRNRFAVGLGLLCLSAWNTPGTALGASMMAAYFAWRERKLRYALVALPVFAGIFGETWIKYGSFFPVAYLTASAPKNLLPYSGGPGFTYPLFFGVLSVLFSFGKGLVFFSPGLGALFSRGIFAAERVGPFLWAGSIYLVGLILVFARWWAWSGDWFWGPRFYLFSSILAVTALTELWGRWALSLRRHIFYVVATGLSIWVSCEGLLFGQDFLEDCFQQGPKVEFICYYVPEYSTLWRLFIIRPPLRGRKIAYFIFFLLVFLSVLRKPAGSLLQSFYSKAAASFSARKASAWRW